MGVFEKLGNTACTYLTRFRMWENSGCRRCRWSRRSIAAVGVAVDSRTLQRRLLRFARFDFPQTKSRLSIYINWKQPLRVNETLRTRTVGTQLLVTLQIRVASFRVAALQSTRVHNNATRTRWRVINSSGVYRTDCFDHNNHRECGRVNLRNHSDKTIPFHLLEQFIDNSV